MRCEICTLPISLTRFTRCNYCAIDKSEKAMFKYCYKYNYSTPRVDSPYYGYTSCVIPCLLVEMDDDYGV